MVWFQCEDCGEDLKKPKLPNHFRICSASKFSCIDCGQTFGQQSVQGHTQCITEAEKYGPKGQVKAVPSAKPNKDSKQQTDIDINVGLSERPPWFCSLCNTSATSKQALLLHAEGKKHRGKARGFHAAKQQPKTQESNPDAKLQTGDAQRDELLGNEHSKEPKLQDSPKAETDISNSEAQKGTSPKKKRKRDASENDGLLKKNKDDTSGDLGNGEVIHENAEAKETRSQSKTDELVDSRSEKQQTKKKIKWKKLITSALKSNPDGVLKMRKLRKLVLKSVQESGITEDETELSNMLEQKINSSSRFTVDSKYVRLVAKD